MKEEGYRMTILMGLLVLVEIVTRKSSKSGGADQEDRSGVKAVVKRGSNLMMMIGGESRAV
jgi:hypothetical protein